MPEWHYPKRQQFDLGLAEPLVLEVEGTSFGFNECWLAGTMSNLPADIHDSILLTLDRRYIRLTVVGADNRVRDAYGVRKGWYTAYFTTPADATREIESWAVLREQPGEPPLGSPWAP